MANCINHYLINKSYNRCFIGFININISSATFFVNKLILAKAIPARIAPKLESMFAIGVDEMSWDDLDGKNYDWPPVAAVRAAH